MAETQQGFALWTSLQRVVILEVNIRSPGVLSQLQSEMRDGHLSDQMWDLYMSRVLEPDDQRLTDPSLPFAHHPWHFIVHRHKIRLLRALEAAKSYCAKHRLPLFIVQVHDKAVKRHHEDKLTAEVRRGLLQRANPEQTKGLPSFLPLYIGMRLVIASKECVRLGLMKG